MHRFFLVQCPQLTTSSREVLLENRLLCSAFNRIFPFWGRIHHLYDLHYRLGPGKWTFGRRSFLFLGTPGRGSHRISAHMEKSDDRMERGNADGSRNRRNSFRQSDPTSFNLVFFYDRFRHFIWSCFPQRPGNDDSLSATIASSVPMGKRDRIFYHHFFFGTDFRPGCRGRDR